MSKLQVQLLCLLQAQYCHRQKVVHKLWCLTAHHLGMHDLLMCCILARVQALCHGAHHVPPPPLRASLPCLPPALSNEYAQDLCAALPPHTTVSLAAALSIAAVTLCTIKSGACIHATGLYTRFTSCGAVWLDHQTSLTRLILFQSKKSQRPQAVGMGHPSSRQAPIGWVLWALSKHPYSHKTL